MEDLLRSLGGGGVGGIFQKLPPNFSEVAFTIDRNQSEAKQYDLQINYLQSYESKSESEIQGEVSMWT